MKICLINNIYGALARGGAEQITALQKRGLEDAGHEVFVISTTPDKKERVGSDYYLPSFYHRLDKLFYPLRIFYHAWSYIDPIKKKAIRKILRTEKPDLVITHNLVGIGFFIPSIIHSLGIKHIHILHDIQLLHPSGLIFWGKERKLDSVFAKLYQGLNKFILQKINCVISPSSWLLETHKQRGFWKNCSTFVIPNPAPEIKSNLNLGWEKRSKLNIIFVGQLEEHKGLDLLISVLEENKFDYRLTLIGAGSLLEKLKLRNNVNIRLMGRLKNELVLEEMKRADVLVTPSLCYENSPTVIYEALRIGLPAIASRIGGITELIHTYGGILFDPGDRNDLAKKIKYLSTNLETIKKRSQRGIGKIQENNLDKYSEKLEKIFSNL